MASTNKVTTYPANGRNKRRDQRGDRPARPKILHAGMTKRSVAKRKPTSSDDTPSMAKPLVRTQPSLGRPWGRVKGGLDRGELSTRARKRTLEPIAKALKVTVAELVE